MMNPGSTTPAAENHHKQKLLKLAGIASVAVALFLFGIKSIAWMQTGSVAMLGSLLDSLLDTAASLINLVFLRNALRPVDHNHRFGHGKAEPLGGIIQAMLIGGSALFLIAESSRRFIEPSLPNNMELGISIMVISCVMVGLLVSFQHYTIRKTGSLIVSGDALHGLGDIMINLGVIAALFLSSYFNAPLIDPLIAIVLAFILIQGAYSIAKQSMSQLMDKEFSQEERSRIRKLALTHPAVTDVHDLRTRRAGFTVFIQLHIEMDGDMSLSDSHEVADEVELSIRKVFPDAEVLIHQDPSGIEQINAFLRS